MIITLKGANFADSNIGKITTWVISAALGTGAVYNGFTAVDRDPVSSLSSTITVTEGYKISDDGVTVTMGGVIQENVVTISEDRKTVTISIPAVTGHVTINAPTVVAPVELTLANATEITGQGTVSTSQTHGAEVLYNGGGTAGIVTWDVPAFAMLTLTVASGGTYGIALTDANNIVLESITNSAIISASSDGVYTFATQTTPTRLHVSKTKFISANYRILSEDEIKELPFSISTTQIETDKYVANGQSVGSAISYADMSSSGVVKSNIIPANTQVSVVVKTGGNYGIALCDTNGIVLESKKNSDAGEDLTLVFAPQSVETVLYASKTKFTSASYRYV